MVIEPQYQSAGFFKEGYALARKDGKSLLIDPTGKVVMEGTHIYGTDWWTYGLTIVQEKAEGSYQLYDIKTKTPVGKPHKIISEQVREGISKVSDDGENYFLINTKGEKPGSHPDWEKTEVIVGFDENAKEKLAIDYQWLWEGKEKFRLKGIGKSPLYKYNKVINKDSFNYVDGAYARYNKIFAWKEKIGKDDITVSTLYLLDTNGNYIATLPYSRFTGLGTKYYYYADTNGQEHIYNLEKKITIDSVLGMESINQDVLVNRFEKNGQMVCRYTDLHTGKVIWTGAYEYPGQTPMVNGKAYITTAQNENLQINRNEKVKKTPAFDYEYYNMYRFSNDPYKIRHNIDEVSRFRFLFKYDTLATYAVMDYNGNTKGQIARSRIYSESETVNEVGDWTGDRVLIFQYQLPDIISASIPREKDTLVMLESIYLPLNNKGEEIFETTSDGYNLVPVDKRGYWLLDLDGNIEMEFKDNTLRTFENGKLKETINGIEDFYYDERSKLIYTNKGYISPDGKTFYFD